MGALHIHFSILYIYNNDDESYDFNLVSALENLYTFSSTFRFHNLQNINRSEEGNAEIVRKLHNDYPSYNHLQFNLFNLFAIFLNEKIFLQFWSKSFSL